MSTIYSSSSGTKDDGRIYILSQSSWANARDGTVATSAHDGFSQSTQFTYVYNVTD